jgi:hypothetical protein
LAPFFFPDSLCRFPLTESDSVIKPVLTLDNFIAQRLYGRLYAYRVARGIDQQHRQPCDGAIEVVDHRACRRILADYMHPEFAFRFDACFLKKGADWRFAHVFCPTMHWM